MESASIAVIGAGSWGTALAKVLADKGHAVTLWGRDAAQLAELDSRRENSKYLPGAALPPSLTTNPDLAAAVHDKRFVVSVVPSHTVRDVFGRAGGAMRSDAIVVSASKGIENESLATMDEVMKDVLPGKLGTRLAFLSGPSFAKEVGQGLPTAVVMAARDRQVAEAAAQLFHAERFRVYTSDDVPGVELGGALKNVIAIASGVADGLGLGYNARAALITRGLAEITRLAVRRAANPMTLAGLAGLGDLVLTCTGDLSRNRSVGLGLGRGKTIEEVLAGMSQVAEGVKTTKSARDLADRLGVEMPITQAMYRLQYEGISAAEAVLDLLGRAPKHELA
jgi:glycerol-3-phosphate dehydrogenase (NAD(P)+)